MRKLFRIALENRLAKDELIAQLDRLNSFELHKRKKKEIKAFFQYVKRHSTTQQQEIFLFFGEKQIKNQLMPELIKNPYLQ